MDQLLTTLAVGGLAYSATNLDALVVLMAFFANPRFTPTQVVMGQYLGLSALLAASLAGSLLSLIIPRADLGLFGFLPLGIGLIHLRKRPAPFDAESTGEATSLANVFAVCGVTVANGGDNLGAYVPLFSTMNALELSTTIVLFGVLTAAWCLAAYQLVRHRALGEPIRMYGARLLPWLLIVLGIYILGRTNALRLF